ncbi:MAG: PAS domain S-box protein [Bacteroidales bacterium]|nr:PAS domain S-box protein [Bacteroidales bacterium]
MKSSPNILIVDDNKGNLLLINSYLKGLDVNIILAFSGSEALKKVDGVELALALIDVQMPEMDGFALSKKLNEKRGENQVPIIIVTAHHFNEVDVAMGYNSGAVDYIIKPITKDILLSKVKIFLDLFNQKQIIRNDALRLKETADKLTRTNHDLKVSEKRISNLMFNMADWVWEIDENGIYTYSSQNSVDFFGLTSEEIIGKTPFDFMSPEENDRFRPVYTEIQKSRNPIKDLENWSIDKYGQKICLQTSGLAFYDEEGVFKGYQGVAKNITKRKLIEQALKTSEEKYKTMLNASPDGILLTDLKGLITDVSEIGLELFGIDNRDDVVGKHFSRFVPSKERNTLVEILKKTMNEGISQNVEMKFRKSNQTLFLGEISSTLIQGVGGIPFSYMFTIRNISQRKKIEAKQIHADRMASLGEMASGIAHEINQPLNTISLIMDNIMSGANKAESIDKDYLNKKADKIFGNITRIRNIIDNIRAFSQSHDDYLLTSFDVNSSIYNAISMISEQFKHLAITLNLQLEEKPPVIIGNTFQFEQVILNLMLNAKDAVLERKSTLAEKFDMFVKIKTFRENNIFVIEIADNGMGIHKDDIEHIMLPFYTTKETGKGTGLGLSISYRIIKEMNGTIDVWSNQFEGTTFRIALNI